MDIVDWKVEFLDFEGPDSFVIQTLDENGQPFYIIVINSSKNWQTQRRAFYHEYDHLQNKDFEHVGETGLSIIEHRAHRI